jgi:hypothetical protein
MISKGLFTTAAFIAPFRSMKTVGLISFHFLINHFNESSKMMMMMVTRLLYFSWLFHMAQCRGYITSMIGLLMNMEQLVECQLQHGNYYITISCCSQSVILSTKISAFWDVTPSSLVDTKLHSGKPAASVFGAKCKQ